MSTQVGSIYYTVEADTGKLLSSTTGVDASLGKLNRQFSATDKSASMAEFQMTKTAVAVRKVNSESAAATSSVSGLGKVLAGALTIQGINSLVQMAEGYNEMAERVRMATSSVEEFNTVQQRLLATANGTYRMLSESQELYIRTADSLRSMGYSTNEVLDITDSMSYAFVKNAASTERANSAISAYTKSINKGRVESDAWESIIAAIPTIIDDIAVATGRSTSAIRELGSSGKISAQALNEGLRRSLDDNKQAADGMAVTVRDAFRSMSNSLSAYLGEANQASGATGILATAIKSLGDNIDVVISALLSIGAGALAGYIASLGKSAISSAQAMIASRAQAAEELALAKAHATTTAAALAHAQANAKLMGSHAGAQTAAVAHTAALTRVASATKLVATIGGTLLRVLGGPIGIISLLAAGAVGFATFGKSAEDAKKPIDLLTTSVTELGDANLRLAKSQALAAIEAMASLGGEASKSAARVETLKKQLQEFPSSANAAKWTKDLEEQEARLENANTKLSAYHETLKKIDDEQARRASGTKPKSDAPVSAVSTTKEDNKAAKEAANLLKENARIIAGLRQELAFAALAGEDLAVAKAKAGLNKAATPAEVAEVTRLAEALWQVHEAERKRAEFGKDPAKTITGNVTPLSGGMFDDQTARYDAEAQAEQQRYADQLARVQEAKALELEVKGGYLALEEQLYQDHADRMIQIEKAKNDIMMSQAASAFGGMASNLEAYVNEFGTKNKALMGMMKAAAIAQTIIQTYQGAQAAYTALAGIPVVGPALGIAAAGAAVAGGMARVSAIRSQSTGGRQYGGPVDASKMYRINENGAPEVFQSANGQQYMLPNTRGEVVSNKDAGGQQGASTVVNIVNNHSSASIRQKQTQMPDGSQQVDVLINDLQTGGTVSQAMQQTFGLRRVGR